MTTTPTPLASDYATAYVKGRKAAQERSPVEENPYRAGTAGFHGWNDGHYDERSARSRAIESQRALVGSEAGAR